MKSLWTRRKNTQSLHLFTLVPFLFGSYIQNNNSRGDNSIRKWRQPARWWARPLKDSWLISLWLGEPCGETGATGWLFRLEHMSYRFPENCIFLDSWRSDSQTAAASSGQPAIATLAQSWNSSHDLKQRRGHSWRDKRTPLKSSYQKPAFAAFLEFCFKKTFAFSFLYFILYYIKQEAKEIWQHNSVLTACVCPDIFTQISALLLPKRENNNTHSLFVHSLKSTKA